MNPTNVTIKGNLTRDPELRYTPDGSPVVSFGVAANERRLRNGEWEDLGADFFEVSAWRNLAENVAESLSKGARVVVSGRLKQRSWETDKGERRSAVQIVADDIGASMLWATVKVERNERRSPDRPPHPADDYAEPAPESAESGAPDPEEEPF